MSTRSLTEAQVRAIASEVGGPGEVVGITAAPRWAGDEVLDTDVGKVRVVACPSVLAVREALVTHGGAADELLLIVTDRSSDELGVEVTARLWGRKLMQPRGWEACTRLFRAQRVDARFARQRWLADLLIDVAPARGYPAAPGGLLDAETAWTAFCRHGLDLRTARPSLADLLAWVHSGTAATALARFGEEAQGHVIERLAAEAGAGAWPVLRLAASGKAAEVLRYGLVVGLLWGPEADSVTAASARGRVIERLGVLDTDAETRARAWGQAAEAFVAEHLGDDPGLAQLRAHAEELLGDLDARELLAASDVLAGAFAARVEELGAAILTALDAPGDGLAADEMGAVRGALARVRRHTDRERNGERTAQAEHAVRLLQRLRAASGEPTGGGFADAARRYVDESSWVDRARFEVGRGASGRFAEACGALLRRVDEQRDAQDRAFADKLARWSAVPPPDHDAVLPIERVLDRVVAPVADQHPAVMIVLDGLDHPTAHQLLGDVTDRGWIAHEPEHQPWPPVVAALPTVTEVSRASLLTGKLTRGGQSEERAGFAAHPRLAGLPGEPTLFHKADLRSSEGHLASGVREALLDTSRHVVGVVVNAVDDLLAKEPQIQPAAGLHGVPVLGWLLETAFEAGRVVVVTSDHGHIRERRTATVQPDGGGERWQPAVREPREDEVRVEGSRVGLGDGRVLLPATETTRYTNERKGGYHGGATPQEALCPVAVLTPARVRLDGYEQTTFVPPWWWDISDAAAPVVAPAPPRTTAAESVGEAAPAAASGDAPGVPAEAVDADGVPTLFAADQPAEAPPPAETAAPSADAVGAARPAWVDELLASPVLASQRKLAGRRQISDDDLVRLLAVLDRHGDVASQGVLLRELDTRPMRLKTIVEQFRKTLAVDGFAVVEVDQEQTVRLNRRLLAEQFGVDAR